MLAVFRRELAAYFASPIGFTFIGFFILLAGVFFAISNLLSGNPNYTGVLGSITFIFRPLSLAAAAWRMDALALRPPPHPSLPPALST